MLETTVVFVVVTLTNKHPEKPVVYRTESSLVFFPPPFWFFKTEFPSSLEHVLELALLELALVDQAGLELRDLPASAS